MHPPLICIISQSHLCRNPRVLKEAITLYKAGYRVVILTAIYSEKLLNEDRQLLNSFDIEYRFFSDLRHRNINTLKAKVARKIAVMLQQQLGLQSIYSLGYEVDRLKKLAIEIDANLYICHQELPTCIGSFLAGKGKKVGFDLEDWYSEDLLPQARRSRPLSLLKKAEQYALHSGAFCITTSQALAVQLADTYKSRLPQVVYNVFPASTHLKQPKRFSYPLRLFWFSQTVGPGRGLEQFITLIVNIKIDLELHLLGAINDSYKQQLTEQMAARHKLVFHPLVPEYLLAETIAQFDIGLALELTTPPSRNFTITNKFFQYLQAGLPVIASATAGQQEIFDQFHPGFLLEDQPLAMQKDQLEAWLTDLNNLQAATEKAIQAALKYNWENEAGKLSALVNEAITK